MNAFDYINELKSVIESSSDGNNVILKKDAYQMVLNVLNLLSGELQNAEYNYVVESIDGKVVTMDKFTMLQKQLSENVLIIQPIPLGEELTQADYESLREVLEKTHECSKMKEDILILPPGINVFKAKLAK